MLNENLREEINELEKKIEETLKSMEIASNLITKTNMEIMKTQEQLQLAEIEIRLNTDFKAVGCNNKEEREMYIMSIPDYRELYLQKRDLEIDLSEYRHRYGVDERQLKMYNKIYSRLVTLEEYELEKELNSNFIEVFDKKE